MTRIVNGVEYYTMGDAAFASNLFGTDFDIGAGYINAPGDYHVWSSEDWKTIPGMKLPIFVAGTTGLRDAEEALTDLEALGAKNCVVALDMELSGYKVNVPYVSSFGAVMQHHGYLVWVYGSASYVFGNPKLNGYWVADYTYTPFMYNHPGTRATQWTDGATYDQSTVKMWEAENLWK